jgi:hypothetical protein
MATQHANKTPIITGPLAGVQHDLQALEQQYGGYLEQESLKGDVQCLRSWIESYQKGDAEAATYLSEHGTSLLENIKTKLKNAAREIQRIDEESPMGANFSGGKSDRLNKAAETALHAEHQLAEALNEEKPTGESPIVAK